MPSFQPLKLPSQKHFALVAQGDLAQVGIFHFFVFIFYFSQSNSLFNFEKYIVHAQPTNLRVNPLTPMVVKTEFLPTISIQCQADK